MILFNMVFEMHFRFDFRLDFRLAALIWTLGIRISESQVLSCDVTTKGVFGREFKGSGIDGQRSGVETSLAL